MGKVFGAEERRVETREHMGKEAQVVVLSRAYDTTVEDLWDAVTSPDRIARWFAPIEGDFKQGGRYAIKGNASGTITRCDRPEAVDVTWEFGGGTSWVTLRLAAVGTKARLTLEHIAHTDGIGKEHLEKFGPGAVGIGWDLGFHGLGQHVADPKAAVREEGEKWGASEDGKAFIRASGEAWYAAHAASGADAASARAQADRTIAFYTGG